MTASTVIIGREGDVELILDSIEVSRKHARIQNTGTSWHIEDLGSANGTSVNGKTIQSPTTLTNKARIEIAGFEIVFESETGRVGPNPVLIGQSPPVQNKTFILPLGDLEIGRVEGNAIVIPDASISRKHARLQVSGLQVRIEDLGSSNGTRVNGETIRTHLLQPGDEVQFGKVTFDFSLTDSGSSTRKAQSFFSQLRGTDTSFKLAAGIGVFSIALLLLSLAVALKRHQGETTKTQPTTTSLHATFETRISIGLLEAENLEKQNEWRASVSSFESVLERDPINKRARAGLARTRAVLDDQRTLARAKETFLQKQYQAAIQSAHRVRETGPLGPEAQEVITNASKELSARSIKEASRACSRKDWRACQKSAIRAAEFGAPREKATKLIDEAERALTQTKVVFIPAALLLP